MGLRVVKPFKSVNRRFNVGDAITAADDLSPYSVESATAAGLISISVEAPSYQPVTSHDTAEDE